MKKATENERGLYHTLATVECPSGLHAAIVARVAHAKQRAAQLRAALFAVLAIVSGALLLPAATYAGQQFYASGFNDYLSLILSDHALVLTYWREFGLSLIESLPSVALLLILPIIASLIWSLSRLVKNARSAIRFA